MLGVGLAAHKFDYTFDLLDSTFLYRVTDRTEIDKDTSYTYS